MYYLFISSSVLFLEDVARFFLEDVARFFLEDVVCFFWGDVVCLFFRVFLLFVCLFLHGLSLSFTDYLFF